MSDPGLKPERNGVPMDASGVRKIVPAAIARLRGADRSGLGDEGWAEVAEDRVGHPEGGNVEPEFYMPASQSNPPDQPV